MMFLSSLRRILRGRARSQGLVEYSLITACLAFAGLAGFNALAGAQKSYLQDYPRNATPPSAPGSLLHPTSVDPCSPPPTSPVKAGTLITCNTTVYDQYSDPYDRNPPMGTLALRLDGTLIASCPLSPMAAIPPLPASASSCALLPWQVPAAYIGQTKSLVAQYEAPTSNHIPSSNLPVPLQFLRNLNFGPATCAPDVEPQPLPFQVLVGHPLRCSVTLTDSSSGSQQPAAVGTPVTWSTVNGGAGVGMFTCFASTFTAINACPRPAIVPTGTASIDCLTDPTGNCSVIYRHLYDSSGFAMGSFPLTVTTSGASPTGVTVQVQHPLNPLHGTGVVGVCTSTDAKVKVTTDPPASPSYADRNVLFQATTDIDVTGPTGTQMQCTATVLDTDPNPIADPGANPNLSTAYPPAGVVHFFVHDGATVTEVALCTLQRVDFWSNSQVPPQVQAQGQAPFLSSCQASEKGTGLPTFTINGTVGGPASFELKYNGEPNTAGHLANNMMIPLSFK